MDRIRELGYKFIKMYVQMFRLQIRDKKVFQQYFDRAECMNKRVVTKTKVFGSDEEESYQVEKIVNHRSINGKKEYKVIWAGYSFEEATWEPEENLKCPQKIKEFQKRYEDVIRKKKLVAMASQSNTTVSSELKQPEPQRQRPPLPPKISNEKSQLSQQQKPPANPAAILNREKLQAAMEKNNLLPPKKSSQIETLKSKIMNPQIATKMKVSPDQLKIPIPTIQSNQTRQVVNTADLFSSPKTSINQSNQMRLNSSKDSLNRSFELSSGSKNGANLIKIQSLSQKVESFDINSGTKIQNRYEDRKLGNFTKKLQQIESSNDRTTSRDTSLEMVGKQNLEERKISYYCESDTMEMDQDSFDRHEEWNDFMKVSERMDIERILGVAESGVERQRVMGIQGGLTCEPKFLLVKNRFSEKEKWVEKERVIEEEPMKLIEYYENLLMEAMGQ